MQHIKHNCYPLVSPTIVDADPTSAASAQIQSPESDTKPDEAIRVSADVWIIKNCLKKKKKHTNMTSSNADAHKCKFGCDVLAPTGIAVLNRLFPVSAERHHPASQKGPRMIKRT